MAATLLKASKQSITAAEQAATVEGIPSPCYVAVQVTASALSATITFEVTVDGSTWAAIELFPTTDVADSALTATATAAGLFVSKGALAVSAVRARCSAFTSASAAAVTVRVACI
jgi:hypothetical protein